MTMSKFLTSAEARAYEEADIENLIPEGKYRVKILSVEPKESNPDTRCFRFKVVGGPYAGRQLRAWPSTAPDLIWTLKRLIGDIVVDPTALQFEDLEGHVFEADVTVEMRKDTGEKTNRVSRLTSCDDDDDDESTPWDDEDGIS
jgi:hypothetical protein